MSKQDDRFDPELMPEDSADSLAERRHPSPEQVLLRMAVEKVLMAKQRKIWEYWNYDRLTHTEIARRMRMSRRNTTYQITRIESQLTTWCREHMAVYNALVEAQRGKREDQ